jgi:hypothetical protein
MLSQLFDLLCGCLLSPTRLLANGKEMSESKRIIEFVLVVLLGLSVSAESYAYANGNRSWILICGLGISVFVLFFVIKGVFKNPS